MRQMFYYKMRQLFYYKMRQEFVTKCLRFLLLQIATVLLQNATVITNCDSTITLHCFCLNNSPLNNVQNKTPYAGRVIGIKNYHFRNCFSSFTNSSSAGFHHLKTSQFICIVNQLTGFYMTGILALQRLRATIFEMSNESNEVKY